MRVPTICSRRGRREHGFRGAILAGGGGVSSVAVAEKKLGEESAPTSSGRGCSSAHSRVAVMKMNRRLEDARPVECCSKVVNYSFLSLDTGPMLCTRSCDGVSMKAANIGVQEGNEGAGKKQMRER